MLRISRKGDYALLLLTCLAQTGTEKVMSLRVVARDKNMPYKYLSQIAPQLVEAGILGSKEGMGGGYFLVKKPADISVGQVLELMEGPVTPVACMREGCFCEPECTQKVVMKKMATSLIKTLERYTLEDLVGHDGS